MNSKVAIKNLIDVPDKFDKAGGTITGESIFNKSLSLKGLSSTEISSSVSTAYTGKGQLFYDSGNKELVIHSVDKIRLSSSGDLVYSTNYPQTSVSGNAGTATKLQTPRTINGTSFDGSSDITTLRWGNAKTFTIGNSSKSVNGQNDMSWSLTEIGAAASSHTHDYLPLSGGTLTGSLSVNSDISATGGFLSNNNKGYSIKDTASVSRNLITMNSSNQIIIGDLNYRTYLFGSANPRYCPSASIGYDIYHEGNKPTPADIGAIPSSKITISQTAPSSPSTGDLWISW